MYRLIFSFVVSFGVASAAPLSTSSQDVSAITLDDSIRFMEENGAPTMASQADYRRLHEAFNRENTQDTPFMRTISVNESEPDQIDKHGNDGQTILDINRKSNVISRLYQGDIMLTKNQIDELITEVSSNSTRRRRQAWLRTSRWSGNVAYYFGPGADSRTRSVFLQAVRFWNMNTCVNIFPSSTAFNRIRVIKGDGCYSSVGEVGGVQDLSLGVGCEQFNTAVHELAHALGVHHQQSRSDRDNFISINLGNIEQDKVDQFARLPGNSFNLGVPYDYGSIMQYDAFAFSYNNRRTMIARDGRYQDTMGSVFPSFYDVQMMNNYYGCHARCSGRRSNCLNGGYPNPRDCSSCICPEGFGGRLCDTLPAGCGSVLKATNQFQVLQNTLGNGVNTIRTNFAKCVFLIVAPQGQRVIIEGQSFQGFYNPGCSFTGVEIRSQADWLKTGYRYCSNQGLRRQFISNTNVVPVITYNRSGSSSVRLTYRIAPWARPGLDTSMIEEETGEQGEEGSGQVPTITGENF